MKVLLVDDEVEFVSTLAERLTMRGFDADDVISGSDAIDQVRKKNYDIVILDLRMVGLDGYDTMKQIQRISPDSKFIILSGHCSEEEYEKMLSAGASDFLVKPINIESILEKIHKIAKITG
jgi:DNA-binding response OmpR family regulator